MTNLEWIMTLNPQDLANNIQHNCRLCIYRDEDGCCSGELKCTKGILKWLEQEHKEELKPCPFCGGKAQIQKGMAGINVFCLNCRAFIMWADSEGEAIELWNRRTGNDR